MSLLLWRTGRIQITWRESGVPILWGRLPLLISGGGRVTSLSTPGFGTQPREWLGALVSRSSAAGCSARSRTRLYTSPCAVVPSLVR